MRSRTFHRIVSVGALLAFGWLVGGAQAKPIGDRQSAAAGPRLPDPGERVLVSSSSSGSSLAKAATDTFYLFGGPGTVEGKFQDSSGSSPDRQGWTGVDLTDTGPFWHVSTFNASNLNGHGAGNHAAWAGQSAAQQPGWATAPGYGNSWDEQLVFRSGPLANPSVGQTAVLDFVFNHDLEPGFDFFTVDYETASGWVNVFSRDATNHDGSGGFSSPGVEFSAQLPLAIVYAGGDYAGPGSDEIILRLRVSSDLNWSDEDGLFESVAGAVQVDDISVAWSDGADFEDFESGFLDGRWLPQKAPFAGDFSKVWPQLSSPDLDPCADNNTPAMGFIDAGQVVGNAASAALIPGYPTSTGGTLPASWPWPGDPGWVVNFTGGLAGAAGVNSARFYNEVWSPEIDWDLPGSADDGPDVVGALLRFSLWSNLPRDNKIGYTWRVRCSPNGVDWGPWKPSTVVFYGLGAGNVTPQWKQVTEDISGLVGAAAKIQIALGVRNLEWDPPILPDATRSPFFDNVAVVKYRVGGPVISATESDLAHDGFPPSGGVDASSSSARDALDIPFDSARDLAYWRLEADPGDSVVVTVTQRLPGATLTDLRMFWVLDRNSRFEDAIRSAPARPQDQNVVAGAGQWSGEVLADSVRLGAVPDRYSFDLPDQDFLYPGDRLRYYFQATDSGGRVTTLPEDTSRFVDGFGYDRAFVVRGLPDLTAFGQPRVLAWIDTGHGADEEVIRFSLGNLFSAQWRSGWGRGIDVYSTTNPRENGLSGNTGHGATLTQLAGYSTILYFGGHRDRYLLGDGDYSRKGKSRDVQLLTDWRSLPGRRSLVVFGDHVASATSAAAWSTAGRTFVEDVLGCAVSGTTVQSALGDSRLNVIALVSRFQRDFALYDGCPEPASFDLLATHNGSEVTHRIGWSWPIIPAGIGQDVFSSTGSKYSLTLPYAFSSVQSQLQKVAGNLPARTVLLLEALNYVRWGQLTSEVPTGAPPSLRELSMTIHPNPFNPSTAVRFTGLPGDAEGLVKIFTVRGELVSVLQDGPFQRSEFRWDGTDRQGRPVSSGVFLVKARVGDWEQTQKIALLK